MSKSSKLFSGLQTSLTDTISELRRDSQSDSGSAREDGVVLISEADTLSTLQTANEVMGAVQLGNDLVEYRLEASELLTQRTQKCLTAMHRALAWQLSCCGGKHVIRLKLTGFFRQFDHEMRPFFDLYLSSGHEAGRCYWVETRCTFTKFVCCRACVIAF